MSPSRPTFTPFIDSNDLLDADYILEPQVLRARAEHEGYLFFPGLLPVGLVTDLRSVALRLAAGMQWLEGDGSQGLARPEINQFRYDDASYIAWLQQLIPRHEFRAIGNFSTITNVFEALFNAPVISQCGDLCRIFFPGSGDRTTLPHQDEFYVKSNTQQWTAWVPLGDCPIALGPLAVIPGSHHRGLQLHQGEDSESMGIDISTDESWACNDYAIGDILMFSNLTIHAGCKNTFSRQVRLSADYRYQPGKQ